MSIIQSSLTFADISQMFDVVIDHPNRRWFLLCNRCSAAFAVAYGSESAENKQTLKDHWTTHVVVIQ